ncbi:hypothetical protein TKK_0009530 [Trichogramma kaykai]
MGNGAQPSHNLSFHIPTHAIMSKYNSKKRKSKYPYLKKMKTNNSNRIMPKPNPGDSSSESESDPYQQSELMQIEEFQTNMSQINLKPHLLLQPHIFSSILIQTNNKPNK